MATAGFNWADAVQNQYNAEVVRVAALNAKAPQDYADACKQWLATNVQSRDRVMNSGFTPTPVPPIPHKLAVDPATAAQIDLGPFPDLVPPVLPPYVEATSTGIAVNTGLPTTDQMLTVIATMLQKQGVDIAAIKTALKV